MVIFACQVLSGYKEGRAKEFFCRMPSSQGLLKPAIFLDRDGTLNVDKGYVSKAEQWEWTPGAVEAIRGFNSLGFCVVVVSNQSGIGRGYYKKEDVDQLHRFVNERLGEHGAKIDAFYFCPHRPEGGCDCRKPRPGLIFQARSAQGIDLGKSFMVGDKEIDVLAALAAGVTPILVETGYGKREKEKVSPGVLILPDLRAVAAYLGCERAGMDNPKNLE